MWGTSKKGTIPAKFLVEANSTSSSAAAAAAAAPFVPPGPSTTGEEVVVDHPMRLNFGDGGVGSSSSLRAFLFGEEGGPGGSEDVNDDIVLERTYCGATGTAMVLEDGRCFVMGSNKNGELG